MEQRKLEKAALELLFDARKAEVPQVRDELGEAAQPEYWLGLCPEMTIGGEIEDDGLEQDLVDPASFARDGYFAAPGVLSTARTSAILKAIEQLRANDWHPMFVFVFDELWTLAWASAVRSIATTLLGERPRLIPHVAVHYIHEEGSPQGWVPHVDGPGRDARISTWVPLTDATVDNGCMYIIPRSDNAAEALDQLSGEELSTTDAKTLLKHVRALPAPAGSVLGWAFDIWHWGSVRKAGAPPRVSVAFEWLGQDGVPRESESPLLDLDRGLPTLHERFDVIFRCVTSYWKFDATLVPFVRLAEQRERVG
jgi:hypothetical protein